MNLLRALAEKGIGTLNTFKEKKKIVLQINGRRKHRNINERRELEKLKLFRPVPRELLQTPLLNMIQLLNVIQLLPEQEGWKRRFFNYFQNF